MWAAEWAVDSHTTGAHMGMWRPCTLRGQQDYVVNTVTGQAHLRVASSLAGVGEATGATAGETTGAAA